MSLMYILKRHGARIKPCNSSFFSLQNQLFCPSHAYSYYGFLDAGSYFSVSSRAQELEFLALMPYYEIS